ncbi:hypothetical protein H5085_19325 [Pseudoalteromonas sp. SR43-6]|jgi:hypothetical protein|uniref:Orphan protein n=2 Tax=root TaxID=1 RepID=F3BNB8_9GAMM|nr:MULTISPECIES: hypothetical protein [Pseudoalteromonas]EGI71898.1 hypothetical protein PH505_cg00190 [Pseudoalteromonas distincta]KAA1163762.1 hypothetical protein EU511_01425 [Pseudoalteromonas distincta]MBA6410708.1 hypothetical protein [Pseudoalteromonas sp. 5Ae-yellow]MBB1278721.1 hypothetical protein [Pseudoalteromonas sp. SR43-3]MBB1291204.1 hypothetical protein [Pseudoalteromonas sp. SR41-5]|tara:strand:- start:918 stop:1277 length:360 start_codon:yes stop_codon:yes gene_type:complete
MKKFIILVVVILAFFTIDHPLIKEPRERLLGEGIGFLSDASKVNRSPAANMAKNRISSQLKLSESEGEYVEKTFTTDDSVQLFHLRYCRERDLNLYFYDDRLNTVCKIVTEALEQKRAK